MQAPEALFRDPVANFTNIRSGLANNCSHILRIDDHANGQIIDVTPTTTVHLLLWRQPYRWEPWLLIGLKKQCVRLTPAYVIKFTFRFMYNCAKPFKRSSPIDARK
uniref:Uncharacterized protein n=1 Tax=Romanomermis culicivorax TaxID=13658 RepID=A0A915HSW9_ROMCU